MRPARRVVVIASLALLVPLAASGCTAGRPPAFAPATAAGGRTLLLGPEVSLGSRIDETAERRIAARLVAELRAVLAERRVRIEGPWSGEDAETARREMLDRMRRSPGERMRAGTAVPLDDALVPLQATGAASVLAVRLLRRPSASEGGYVPRPPGELVELPDERLDYEVPSAEAYATGGVELEILLVDAGTSRVVTHRRVSHPVTGEDVDAVLAPLVRLAARGISADGR